MLAWLAVVTVLLGVLYVAARRAITVAELTFAGGTVHVRRGGIAPPILADLRDVARSTPATFHVRIVRDRGRADVRFRGAVDERVRQRVRNVVGRVPLARLVNAVRT